MQFLATGIQNIVRLIADYRPDGMPQSNTALVPVPPRRTVDLQTMSLFKDNKKHAKQRRHRHFGDSHSGVRRTKTFQFICTPHCNDEHGPPQVPKKYSEDHLYITQKRMIQDISFEDSKHEYCVNKIREAFSHLPLRVWRFYKVNGCANQFLSLEGFYTFDTFDLRNLEEYLSRLNS
jgi:hypothetical protein